MTSPTKSERAFARRIDALDELFAFVQHALAISPLDAARRHAVQFTIEEFFTNMVKYAPAGAPTIGLEIECAETGVAVTLIDTDVEPFDPTRAPDAKVDAPIADRTPGGLGLHVLRRLVDSLSYRYDASRREGRTHFVVSTHTHPKPAAGPSPC